MFELNILDLIPQEIQTQARDALVDFVTDQAKKHLNDEMATRLKKLRSDAAFNKQFEAGLQRAAGRFIAEYEEQDEDLTAAIAADQNFFQNEQVQQALLAMVKKPGAYLVEEQDRVRVSFESVMPERKNRQRVDRAVTYLLKCLAEELWHLPELLPIYSLQFQRITAEASRQQVEIQQAHLQATLQLDANMRQALAQLTEAMQKNLLAAPALAALPAPRPKPYHNLPRPDYSRFVGRETELAWLRQRLSPQDRAWQIAITGIGGVGKSALALAIAHEYRENYDQLPPEERFDAIIWISAKEEVLTAQGREKALVPGDVLRTLEDVYTAISRALDREDITRSLPEDQGRVVEKALKEQRTLLIMDNLESVKDERIRPFLRNLPEPTKAIITSREWLDVADVLMVKGMSVLDASIFIQEEAESRQLKLGQAQQNRIYDLTSGLPLPIKLAVARLSSGENFAAVERWLGDADGELPEYCIIGQAELARQRNPNTWKLLLACSLYERIAGASADALGYTTELSIADRDNGISQLLRLFLINRTETDRFWVLPIVQRFASVQLVNNLHLIDSWLEWLVQFTLKYGMRLRLSRIEIQTIEIEYPNLLSAIRYCRDNKLWTPLRKLARGTCYFVYTRSLYSELNEILDAIDIALRNEDDEELQGIVALQRSRVAVIQNQPIEPILAYLDKAERIARKHAMLEELSEALATKTDLLRHNHQYRESEQVAQEMLKVGQETANDFIIYSAYVRLFSSSSSQNDTAQSSIWLNKAKAMTDNSGELQHRFTNNLIISGHYAFLIQDFETAEKCFLEALERDSALNLRRFVALDQYNLARVYVQRGKSQLAQHLVEDALETFERLGMKAYSDRARSFLKSF